MLQQSIDRKLAQAGSVTFIQRFGSAINVNVHVHPLFLEGVYVDRSAKGLKPRFVQVEPLSDAEIVDVVHVCGELVQGYRV